MIDHKLQSILSAMPDQQLQQVIDSPLTNTITRLMAMSEAEDRNRTRQGQAVSTGSPPPVAKQLADKLGAQTMYGQGGAQRHFASGGIARYASGGLVKPEGITESQWRLFLAITGGRYPTTPSRSDVEQTLANFSKSDPAEYQRLAQETWPPRTSMQKAVAAEMPAVTPASDQPATQLVPQPAPQPAPQSDSTYILATATRPIKAGIYNYKPEKEVSAEEYMARALAAKKMSLTPEQQAAMEAKKQDVLDKSILEFGLRAMIAGGKPGATTLGALGEAGIGALSTYKAGMSDIAAEAEAARKERARLYQKGIEAEYGVKSRNIAGMNDAQKFNILRGIEAQRAELERSGKLSRAQDAKLQYFAAVVDQLRRALEASRAMDQNLGVTSKETEYLSIQFNSAVERYRQVLDEYIANKGYSLTKAGTRPALTRRAASPGQQ